MYNIQLEHPSTRIKFTAQILGHPPELRDQIEQELNTRLNLISDIVIIILKKFLIKEIGGRIGRPGETPRFKHNDVAGTAYAYLQGAGDEHKTADQASEIEIDVDISFFYQELLNLLIRIENHTRLKAKANIGFAKSAAFNAFESADPHKIRFIIALTAMYSSTSKRCKFLTRSLLATRSFNGDNNIGSMQDHEIQFFTINIQTAFDNLMIDPHLDDEHYLKRIAVLYGYLELIEYWLNPEYNDVLNDHLFGSGLTELTT